jgi:hypothetical protein
MHRCQPPEPTTTHPWHWLIRHNGTDKPEFTVLVWFSTSRSWFNGDSMMDTVYLYSKGWRYWAPAIPPAEAAA